MAADSPGRGSVFYEEEGDTVVLLTPDSYYSLETQLSSLPTDISNDGSSAQGRLYKNG